jgi:hypothetical protein
LSVESFVFQEPVGAVPLDTRDKFDGVEGWRTPLIVEFWNKVLILN